MKRLVMAVLLAGPFLALPTPRAAIACVQSDPSSPQVLRSPQTAPAPSDYARREAQATDLEEFRGGSVGGLVIALAIVGVVALIILVAILIPW